MADPTGPATNTIGSTVEAPGPVDAHVVFCNKGNYQALRTPELNEASPLSGSGIDKIAEVSDSLVRQVGGDPLNTALVHAESAKSAIDQAKKTLNFQCGETPISSLPQSWPVPKV